MGTAESFAYQISKKAKKYGFHRKVIDLDGFDGEELYDMKLVLFIVATYGEEEPTDTTSEFYQWSKDDTRMNDEFKNLDYCVFGCGNTQYEFFNQMGKEFDKIFTYLDGNKILELALGYDDLDIDDQFTC